MHLELAKQTKSSRDDVLVMVELEKKKKRSLWVHPILFIREEMTQFYATIQELKFDPDKFQKSYFWRTILPTGSTLGVEKQS